MKIIDDRLRLSASDVANFLACQHLTRLDLLRARGALEPPYVFDVGFLDLVARGEAHERTVLGQFRADGRQITEITGGPEASAAAATLEAVRGGVEVIYQGVLLQQESTDGPALLGRPDFLVRADLLTRARRGAPPWRRRTTRLSTPSSPGPPRHAP